MVRKGNVAPAVHALQGPHTTGWTLKGHFTQTSTKKILIYTKLLWSHTSNRLLVYFRATMDLDFKNFTFSFLTTGSTKVLLLNLVFISSCQRRFVSRIVQKLQHEPVTHWSWSTGICFLIAFFILTAKQEVWCITGTLSAEQIHFIWL